MIMPSDKKSKTEEDFTKFIRSRAMKETLADLDECEPSPANQNRMLSPVQVQPETCQSDTNRSVQDYLFAINEKCRKEEEQEKLEKAKEISKREKEEKLE